MTVAKAFCDPTYDEYGFDNGFSISTGRHHLNGYQALAFARVRKANGESDFTRAARQQEVISGIRESIVHGGFLNDPVGLLKAIGKTVTTNVPRKLLPDLADMANQVGREQTYRAVITHPLVGSGYDDRGSIQIPDVKAIRKLAASLFPTDGSMPDDKYALKAATGSVKGSGVGSCAAETHPETHPEADGEAHPEAVRQAERHAPGHREPERHPGRHAIAGAVAEPGDALDPGLVRSGEATDRSGAGKMEP